MVTSASRDLRVVGSLLGEGLEVFIYSLKFSYDLFVHFHLYLYSSVVLLFPVFINICICLLCELLLVSVPFNVAALSVQIHLAS